MEAVQWPWVKAHAGFLLNECADMLATKGVLNETPPASVQFLHPTNEYTDVKEYVFPDQLDWRYSPSRSEPLSDEQAAYLCPSPCPNTRHRSPADFAIRDNAQ
jgi:hypothetical protein